jgi:hypothetical protein
MFPQSEHFPSRFRFICVLLLIIAEQDLEQYLGLLVSFPQQ